MIGCLHQKSYRYSDIRQEYSDMICKLSPLEVSPEGKETCALNKSISLQEAIEIALANNPDKQIATTRIHTANAILNQAKVPFYPFISVYTEYLNGDAPSAYLFKTIDQRDLAPQTDFNDPGRIENIETGLQAKLNIYNGGKDMLNKQIAELGVDISQFDHQTVQNSIITSVIHAYYDALAAKDYIKIAEESVSTVETQLKIMKVRFEGGSALKSDILSLEVRLAQAKEDVVRSQNTYRMAITALANILGVSPDNQIQLSPVQSFFPSIPDAYISAIDDAMMRRPEVKKIKEQVRQSRMALDVARSGYLPSLDLMTKFYIDGDSPAYEMDNLNWTVALMLNWNIFTGFSVEAEEQKALASLEQILAADRQTSLLIKTDVKNAYFKLDEANARLQVAQKSVDMAEESLALVKNQYEGGSANITRYLEAELDRNRARLRATAAFYDKEKAIADIARSIGYWSTYKPSGK